MTLAVMAVMEGSLRAAVAATTVSNLSNLSYFIQNYPQHFLDKIKMIKIDTEGHDVVILEDMKHFNFRPPIIWTEWFEMYKFVNISNNLVWEVR